MRLAAFVAIAASAAGCGTAPPSPPPADASQAPAPTVAAIAAPTATTPTAAAAAAPTATAAAALVPPATPPAGPTRVVFLLPKGEVDAHAPAAVGFDRPMVPLTQVDDDVAAPWLEVDPPVAVRARWVDPQTLSVFPRAGWPSAAEVTLRVRSGAVRSLDGTALGMDAQTTLQTAPLAVTAYLPTGTDQPRDPAVAIRFSLPIRADDVKSALTLRSTGALALPPWQVVVPATAAERDRALGRAPKPARRDGKSGAAQGEGEAEAEEEDEEGEDEDDPGTWPPGYLAVVRFDRPLEQLTEVEAVLAAGMRPAQGTRGLATAQRWRFLVHGPMRAITVGCDSPCSAAGWPSPFFTFSNAVQEGEDERLAKAVTVEPPVKGLRVSCYQTRCSVGGELSPSTTYRLHVPAGVADHHGQKSESAVDGSFTTGPLSPELTRLTEGSVWEAAGPLPRRMSWSAVNISGAMRAWRIDAATWMRVVEADQDRDAPKLLGAAALGAPLHSLPFVAADDKTAVFHLDLDRALATTGPVLALVGPVGKGAALPPSPSDGLVQVTDLHIHTRSGAGKVLAWVTSYGKGAPVAGAEVTLHQAGGKRVAGGTTDSQGLVTLPSAPAPAWVVASHGPDTALLALDWTTSLASSWDEPVVLRSVMFLEKELFRPGETAHVRGVLRRVDGAQMELPGAGSVEVSLRDPHDEQIAVVQVPLSVHGAFAVPLAIPAKARYGSWDVQATFRVGGLEHHDRASFRIATYEAQKVEATVAARQEHVLPRESFSIETSASWLSGGPMRGADVDLQVMAVQEPWAPSGWDRFDFGDEPASDDPAAPIASFSHSEHGVLGRDGALVQRIQAPSTFVGPQRLVAEATVKDPSGGTLSRSTSLWLQPSARAVGLRAQALVAVAGQATGLEAVVTDLDGKADVTTPLQVRVLRRTHQTIRRESAGGTWDWITTTTEQEVATCSPKIDAASGVRSCPVTLPAAGSYALEASVRDPAGRTRRARTYFWASGPGAVNWGGDDDAAQEMLVADQETYKPGDTARVLVRNPAPGALALICEDRGGVRRVRQVRLEHAAETIEIPIGVDAVPNLFVSVVLFRGRTVDAAPVRLDRGGPVAKVGVVELTVDSGAHQLQLAIDVPSEQQRPGDEVEVGVTVRNAAGEPVAGEVTLAVVDEGVLALTGFETPNPFEPLYERLPHAVSDHATAGLLVRKRVGEEKGAPGGDGEGGGPMLRGNFRDLAYYAPALTADARGRVKAKFRVPDNLTAWRVMAIALHGARDFGSADKQFRVGKPLMFEPRLPHGAQPGDIVEVSVTARDGRAPGGKAGGTRSGAASLRVEGPAQLQGEVERPFTLAAGAATELRFTLRILGTGEVRLRLQGAYSGAPAAADGVEVRLLARDMRPMEATAMLGRSDVDSGVEVEQVVVRPEGSTDQGGLELTVAATGAVQLKAQLDALAGYPYACGEQTASRLLALYEIQGLQRSHGLFGEVDAADLDVRMAEAWKRIEVLSGSDGGVQAWPGMYRERETVAVTAWLAVVGAAIEAQHGRLEVFRRNELRRYLEKSLHSSDVRSAGPSLMVPVVHGLVVLGAAVDDRLSKLFLERAGLSRGLRLQLGLAMAAAGKPARREQARGIAAEEAGRLQVEAARAFLPEEGSSGWNTTTRDEAMLLALLVAVVPDHPLIDRLGRGLQDRRRVARWSTQEDAWGLIGMGAWLRAVERVEPAFTVRGQAGDRAFGPVAFRGRGQDATRWELPQTALVAGQPAPVRLDRDGPGAMYWSMRYRYVQPAIADAARNAGLVVRRRFVTADGALNPSAIDRGTYGVVELEIWSGAERSDVAVADPLPAGLEAMGFDMDGQSTVMHRRLAALQLGRDGEAGDVAIEDGADVAYRELRPEQVRYFLTTLPAGRTILRYAVRARARGVVRWQGTSAEAMYAPEVFGRAAATMLEVR